MWAWLRGGLSRHCSVDPMGPECSEVALAGKWGLGKWLGVRGMLIT